jgi:hypothetical protein
MLTKWQHPTKCGYEGVLYAKEDYVTPISDSLRRLLHTTQQPSEYNVGWTSGSWGVDMETRSSPLETNIAARRKRALVSSCPNPNCSGGDAAASFCEYAEACVCTHCGAVMPNETRFVPSFEEKESASVVTTTSGGSAFVSLHGLTGAQRAVRADADARLWQDGLVMSKNDQLRLVRVLEALNRLFVDIAPVDVELQQEINSFCERAWNACVLHARKCTDACKCAVRLQDRSTGIIALAVAETLLGSIAKGKRDDQLQQRAVSRESARAVLQRLKATAEYGNCTCVTQLGATRCIVKMLTAESFDASRPCASQSGPVELVRCTRSKIHKATRPDVAGADPGMARVESWEDPTTLTYALLKATNELKEAVQKVYLAHGAGALPRAVRTIALDCVQDAEFSRAAREVGKLECHPNQSVALVVLRAVEIRCEEHRARESGTSILSVFSTAPSPNQVVAGKLKLDPTLVEEAARRLAPLVPVHALERVGRDEEKRNDLLACF